VEGGQVSPRPDTARIDDPSIFVGSIHITLPLELSVRTETDRDGTTVWFEADTPQKLEAGLRLFSAEADALARDVPEYYGQKESE
jgi:hypothetical protein